MKRLILLIFSTCFSISNALAQDTLYFLNDYKFSYFFDNNKYFIDNFKSSIPKIYLTKKSKVAFNDTNSLLNYEENQVLILNKIYEENTFCIFKYKNKIIETGFFKLEFFVGKYKSFYKNGILKKEGEYNSFGNEIGVWNYYNSKGKLELIVEFKDGIVVKKKKY